MCGIVTRRRVVNGGGNLESLRYIRSVSHLQKISLVVAHLWQLSANTSVGSGFSVATSLSTRVNSVRIVLTAVNTAKTTTLHTRM